MLYRLFVEGGFRWLAYRLLAAGCLMALTNEVATNGLDDDAYLYAFVAAMMFIALYSDD